MRPPARLTIWRSNNDSPSPVFPIIVVAQGVGPSPIVEPITLLRFELMHVPYAFVFSHEALSYAQKLG